MERLRPLALLVAVCAGAFVPAWLGARGGPAEPAGSTRSAAPEGGRALFLWTESLGRRAERLELPQPAPPPGPPARVVLVLAPVLPVDAPARQTLDAVPAQGGTLILAGDPRSYAGYLELLGIEATAVFPQLRAEAPGSRLRVQVVSTFRLRGAGTSPVLVASNGDALAVRKPYLNGEVVVVTSVLPFTNDGLRDEATARFVYRLLSDAAPPGTTVAFDETHYAALLPSGEPVQTFGDLLRGTAPGRALLYAGLLGLAFLALGEQRLGPALPSADATAPSRTMYEQVQALAGLYRRAGQFPYLRQHFAATYRRALGRAAGLEGAVQDTADPRLAGRLAARGIPADRVGALIAAVRRVEGAQNEGQLLEAVRRVEGALADLPVSRSQVYGTLTGREA